VDIRKSFKVADLEKNRTNVQQNEERGRPMSSGLLKGGDSVATMVCKDPEQRIGKNSRWHLRLVDVVKDKKVERD
jgi:hypothetical protein